MDSKFTKRDWKVKHSESKNAFNVIGTLLGGRYKIARCPYLAAYTSEKLNEQEKQEQEANAKLIAAAPEMFDELVKIMETYDKGTETYIRVMKLLTKITE